MPRQSRIDAPGALHHVIIRGVERKSIFKDDADLTEFIERSASIFADSSTPCFAWALMTNHVPLPIRTADTLLATLMRRLLTGYAMAFNRRYRRPELVGGGLIRSVGGWKVTKTLLKGHDRVKGYELGDSNFVQSVLKRCNEDYSLRQRRIAQGDDLKTLSHVLHLVKS